MRLPEEYLGQVKTIFKDDYNAYLDCFNNPSFFGLRANTSKISIENFQAISPFKLRQVPWCKDGFYCDKHVGKHPYYYAGLYYIQEPSAMAPAEILPIEEGDFVLDACSAPGGKATKLANKLNGTGILVSNDISASRQNATLKNIERFGLKNCYVISEDTKKLKDKYPCFFDKILVDAPCSGEGMFRKDPSLINSWLEKGNDYYPPIQKEILDNCVEMLKDGGYLLYSTCTFNTCENEEIVKHCLDKHPEMKLMNIHKDYPFFEKGIGLEECARLYPFKLDGEGHFVALMKKDGKASTNKTSNFSSYQNNSLSDFLKLCNINVDNYHIERINDGIHLLPNHDFDNASIRTLRSGLLLGSIKKDVFDPSQALAMSLKSNEFAQVIDLSIEDLRVEKYLKGETISIEQNYKGWTLICVDGYPLGFGKANNHKLKNKIDSGWRVL